LGASSAAPWRRSREGQRLLIGALGDGDALQPTLRRALFIIVNMQARPRFSSPISQPIAPPLSP
jgi:hypothetical protein